MADVMYPAAGVTRKTLPTCTNFIVTKWDFANKYREEEMITDESGQVTNVIGIDSTDEVEAELVVKPAGAIPEPLTTMTFSGGAAGTAGVYLIIGEVKVLGSAGQAQKIGVKLMKNATVPAQS